MWPRASVMARPKASALCCCSCQREPRAGRAGPASLERSLTRPHSRLVMGLKQPCLKFIFKIFLIFHFRKCDVLNRGFSGYNTRWAKIILPRLIRKGNILDSPVAVTIFFGANDSALKGKGVLVFSQFIFHVTANLHVCAGS